MTAKEKLAILEAAEERAYGELARMTGADMATESMGHLMKGIEALARAYWHNADNVHDDDDDDQDEVEAKPKVKLDPIEEPKPIEEKPETPALTKAQMVTKLTAFQNSGVDIRVEMEAMGCTKLSDVPADRYWELLERCQKIADGEG
jgi:hypothetical protein